MFKFGIDKRLEKIEGVCDRMCRGVFKRIDEFDI